jgi:hypothetical protein
MVLAFLLEVCILYVLLIEITLCKFVETSLVANGYHPVSKAGEETAGAERSDYEPKMLVRTKRVGIRRTSPICKGTRHSTFFLHYPKGYAYCMYR